MEWNVLLGLGCTLLGAALSYRSFVRTRSREERSEGQQSGMMLTELGYIKGGVDDIKRDQREQHRVNTEVFSRLTAVESSTKQAHRRIDRIEGSAEPS